MTSLAFRNVRADPDDPVETWPVEAVQAALERGSLTHWHRLVSAIRADPWGPVAQAVDEVLSYSQPYGVHGLMTRAISAARQDAERTERTEVAAEIRNLVERSGLSRAEFASRIGTSASRLSTYSSGKVVPAATLLLRMRRVTSRAERSRG
jgi:DNA-binding transcriptional regulator YiaG